MAVFYSKVNGGPYLKEGEKVCARHSPTIVAFPDLLPGKNFLGDKSYSLPVFITIRGG
jgi:hypothetical protein